MKFGLIPEFVGRLPVMVTLDPLDEEAMTRILTIGKQLGRYVRTNGQERPTVPTSQLPPSA